MTGRYFVCHFERAREESFPTAGFKTLKLHHYRKIGVVSSFGVDSMLTAHSHRLAGCAQVSFLSTPVGAEHLRHAPESGRRSSGWVAAEVLETSHVGLDC
jgi:hypothetical protein